MTGYGAVEHSIVGIEHRDGAWHATVDCRGHIVHITCAEGSQRWYYRDMVVVGSLARHLDEAVAGIG